jgi:inorganic phosphate transporter, PiT family
LLIAVSATIYIRSRKNKVDHNNVNNEWEGGLTAGLEDDEGKPAGTGARVGAGAGSDDQTI